MKASIIIPTINRADQLFRCMNKMVELDFASNEYEIIVIDNGSTDNTKEIVECYFKENPHHNIRYFYDDLPGLLTGRHRGAKEAKSDILVFADDDIHPDIGWLTAIVDTFECFPDVHLVGGKCLPKYEIEPPAWLDYFWQNSPDGGKNISYLSLCDYGDEIKEIDPCKVWGLNFSIRKASLYECGGFNPDTYPISHQYLQGDGETGLCLKIAKKGYKACYNPKALVYHEVTAERMTMAYFDKRFFFDGVGWSYNSLRKNGGSANNSSLKKVWLFEKKMLYKIKCLISQLLKKPKLVQENSEFEITMLRARFLSMQNAGYKFHQEMAKKYPFVMDWVLKEDYFDYKLPKINH